MNETIGNNLHFYAFFTKNKVGISSLSPLVDIYRNGILAATDGAAALIGSGLYLYTYLAGGVDQEGEYVAVFKTSDTTVDQQHIPALWVVNKADVEKLALIQNQTDLLPANPAATGDEMALDTPTHVQIVDDVQQGMIAQGYTTGRADQLDNLDAPVAGVPGAVCEEALNGHNTPGTLGEALILARAQAAGKWVIFGDQIQLFDVDGTTLLATLALEPAGGPYLSRTPV